MMSCLTAKGKVIAPYFFIVPLSAENLDDLEWALAFAG
jgi:hypothetical protein